MSAASQVGHQTAKEHFSTCSNSRNSLLSNRSTRCAEYMDEAKHDEYVRELAEIFGIFGTVLTSEVRIRDTFEDGQHKVSWGVVTFIDETAARKAVTESATLDRPGWVVRVRQKSLVFVVEASDRPFTAARRQITASRKVDI
jgi:hypothetical protein